MGDDDEGDLAKGTVVLIGRTFGVGNKSAVTHGARSEALVSTVASDLAEALIGEYPWFLDTDIVGIEQYCRAEARTRLLNEYAMTIVDNEGIEHVPMGIWEQLTKAENNAMRAAEALGLTPLGRLKIIKDGSMAKHFASTGVGDLRAQGQALRSGSQ